MRGRIRPVSSSVLPLVVHVPITSRRASGAMPCCVVWVCWVTGNSPRLSADRDCRSCLSKLIRAQLLRVQGMTNGGIARLRYGVTLRRIQTLHRSRSPPLRIRGGRLRQVCSPSLGPKYRHFLPCRRSRASASSVLAPIVEPPQKTSEFLLKREGLPVRLHEISDHIILGDLADAEWPITLLNSVFANRRYNL